MKEAASTALTIDPTLGPAHEALGYYNFAYEWNWTDAELEFRKAVALGPDDEATHRYYGMFLRAQRRWADAIDSIGRAVAIDPRSAETVKALGATYFWAGQYDHAIEQYRKACDLDPTHLQARDLLADAYAAKGMYAEALEARREYLRRDGAFEAAESLGSDASEQGYQQAMRALYKRYLQALERAAPQQYVSPLEFALVYIGLDEKDRAFGMLEKAYGERSPWLASLAADPAFDPLRSDPRFRELLRRVGLSDLLP